MSALLTLAQSLGIDPGPLNQTELQEQTCMAALDALIRAAEILRTSTAEHTRMWKESRQMESERNELAAKVERLRKLIMDKTAQSVFSRAPGIPSCCRGMEITWPDDVVAVLLQTPPAALAALKAQWQADILAEISLQVSASKPVATPIQIATAILTESKRIRQREQ